jgi:hypothetical protein
MKWVEAGAALFQLYRTERFFAIDAGMITLKIEEWMWI